MYMYILSILFILQRMKSYFKKNRERYAFICSLFNISAPSVLLVTLNLTSLGICSIRCRPGLCSWSWVTSTRWRNNLQQKCSLRADGGKSPWTMERWSTRDWSGVVTLTSTFTLLYIYIHVLHYTCTCMYFCHCVTIYRFCWFPIGERQFGIF